MLTTLVATPQASAMGPDNPDIAIAPDTYGGTVIVDINTQIANIKILDGVTVLYDGLPDTYQIAFAVAYGTFTVGQSLDIETKTTANGPAASWTEVLTTPAALPSRVAMQAELDAAELLFAPVSQDYLVSYRTSCFCLPIGPVVVQVLDGQTVQTSSQPVPGGPVQGQNVDDFFSIIQDAINDAAAVIVEYDSTYGYPTYISIDYGFMLADDEIGYTIHGFAVTSDPNLPTCEGHTITALGTAGNDLIVGGPGADVVLALGGHDEIRTLGGDDVICAGSGHDEVEAGQGDDIVRGQIGDDSILGGSGEDKLFGGWGNDIVDGGDDNDLVTGFLGFDILSGGAGADTIRGGEDDDIINGNDDADELSGNKGDDVIHGDDGADLIRGHRGNDTLFGDAGDDLVLGHRGVDIMSGGDGDDTLRGGKDSDTIFGDAGDDIVSGGAHNDTLSGGADIDDECYGNQGVDTADASCETIGSIP